MAVNKVVINDAVVLDLTGDTVRAADTAETGNPAAKRHSDTRERA